MCKISLFPFSVVLFCSSLGQYVWCLDDSNIIHERIVSTLGRSGWSLANCCIDINAFNGVGGSILSYGHSVFYSKIVMPILVWRTLLLFQILPSLSKFCVRFVCGRKLFCSSTSIIYFHFCTSFIFVLWKIDSYFHGSGIDIMFIMESAL